MIRFFDIDDDKKPELCIEKSPYFIYIIKYDDVKNNFILWNTYENIYLSIYGTKEIGRELYDQLGYFIKLDAKGETACTTWFKYIPYLYYGKEEKICYLVSLPVYSNNTEIDEELKAAACYVENTDIYYFRVSEAQFNELYSLYNLDKTNIDNITYSYAEFMK